jgi:hypothetical protein
VGYWRQKAKEIIGRALDEAGDKKNSARALRRHVSGYYGEYAEKRWKYHYRVWREEVEKAIYPLHLGIKQLELGIDP